MILTGRKHYANRCKATNVWAVKRPAKKRQNPPADLRTLMVWVNRAGRWERIDAAVQFRKSKRSICRQVVTKVFGLSGKQYEAIRDALEDVHSGDLMGIYKHESVPGRYAIVLRLPVGDRFANLKIGGAAGTGVLLGGVAMWAKGKRGKESGRKVTQGEIEKRQEEIEKRWRDAYLAYIMKSNQLRATELTIKQLLKIERRSNCLFPFYHVSELFDEWYGATPEEKKEIRIRTTNRLKKQRHLGADKIIGVGPSLKAGAGVPPGVHHEYVAQLLHGESPAQNVEEREQRESLAQNLKGSQRQLISIAVDLQGDYDVLTKNQEME